MASISKGHLALSYMERYKHPEIARAFSAAPQEEGISGMPSFEQLLSHPGMRSLERAGLSVVRGATALRGVTVAVSVALVDENGIVRAECCWRAGHGTFFRMSG